MLVATLLGVRVSVSGDIANGRVLHLSDKDYRIGGASWLSSFNPECNCK